MSSVHTPEEAAVIRGLNDRLRTTLCGGDVMVTQGVRDLGAELLHSAIIALRLFSTFDADNDPHGEHDFGRLQVGGETILWKIDYYDLSLEGGSSNPADPAVTRRVLTLLLPLEW